MACGAHPLSHLSPPSPSLERQMLLASEGVDLHFTEAAINEVAGIAEELNRSLENIGARRLHTVIERIVEPISFSAPDLASQVRAAAAAAVCIRVKVCIWCVCVCVCVCVCQRERKRRSDFTVHLEATGPILDLRERERESFKE
jgi:hypothetical protein